MLNFSKEELEQVAEMLIKYKGIRYSRENEHKLDEYVGTDKDWLYDAYYKGWKDCEEYHKENNHNIVKEFQSMMMEDMKDFDPTLA